MRFRSLAIAVAIAVPGAMQMSAQGSRAASAAPTVSQIVTIASAYATDFVEHFAGVVAEEDYAQKYLPIGWTIPRSRQLLSDVLLVRLPDGDFAFFRDVVSVDGMRLRDRDNRLATLLLTPSPSAIEQAEALAAESARHNLVDIGTRDNPLAAMAMLQDRYVRRFKARNGGRDRRAGERVWIVVLEESVRPTLLRGAKDRDAPSEVRAWVDFDAQRVIKTQLRMAGSLFGTTTEFSWDPRLGFAVPVRMSHQFGVATYSSFRRFQVTTEEAVQ
jgi:hypothetical protein